LKLWPDVYKSSRSVSPLVAKRLAAILQTGRGPVVPVPAALRRALSAFHDAPTRHSGFVPASSFALHFAFALDKLCFALSPARDFNFQFFGLHFDSPCSLSYPSSRGMGARKDSVYRWRVEPRIHRDRRPLARHFASASNSENSGVLVMATLIPPAARRHPSRAWRR